MFRRWLTILRSGQATLLERRTSRVALYRLTCDGLTFRVFYDRGSRVLIDVLCVKDRGAKPVIRSKREKIRRSIRLAKGLVA